MPGPSLLQRLTRRLGARGRAQREAREAAAAERTAARVAARRAQEEHAARRERERTLAALSAEARHAEEQLALYRRRDYLGQADPRRLAELERVAAGAADRLRRAQQG